MKVEKDEFLTEGGVCNDDDETTASGRPFHTWAAASGKARLPNNLLHHVAQVHSAAGRVPAPDAFLDMMSITVVGIGGKVDGEYTWYSNDHRFQNVHAYNCRSILHIL